MKTGDHLALDDEAWVAISPLRHANVLLVTSGNPELERNMGTSPVEEIAQVTVQSPAFLAKEPYQQQASTGAYDLVIYDRCQPKEMPQANTFFLGSLPSGDAWKAKPKSGRLHIIDTDSAHPMMQWIDLGNVEIAAATPLELPPGGRTLIDSTAGPLLAIAPREGFEDAVLGFVLIDDLPGGDGKKGRYIGTNWFIRPSFPDLRVQHAFLPGWVAIGDRQGKHPAGAAGCSGEPQSRETTDRSHSRRQEHST